ncbi:MAG: glycosyltransferase [Bacteroidota bacterium]
MNRPKRILVAVLNWGLGHATRCIPIIRELQRQGADVLIASDGRALALLQKEFPTLSCHTLPTYGIRYATSNMFWNMATQLPGILSAIYREQRFIETFVKSHNIDIIISDNRYGCRSTDCRNIFLTHQLNIKIPNRFLEYLVARINQKLIGRFQECWIPDYETTPNLSGDLSHGKTKVNRRFIGVLSRMQHLTKVRKEQDVIVVLSGPEPQRSRLEAKIIAQAKALPTHNFLIISGQTDQPATTMRLSPNVTQIAYLTSRQLNEAIAASSTVICRAGYSSIMDLVQLQKPAILIPTPGQTEQEYLAERFHRQGIFYRQSQADLDLAKAIKEINKYATSFKRSATQAHLAKAVEKLLQGQSVNS